MNTEPQKAVSIIECDMKVVISNGINTTASGGAYLTSSKAVSLDVYRATANNLANNEP